MRVLTLRNGNNLLSLIIIVLAVYIITWPFLPSVTWWAKYQAPIVSSAPSVDLSAPAPQDNTLIIPILGMSERIYEGKTVATLSKGVWHRPASSTPDKQGNTVLSGHRFTYSGKAVFYYLDKVRQGDPVYVYWEGKQYKYEVTAVIEVPPDATNIEDPTTEPRLTIYTCTPLWSAKNRLVIQAELTGIQS